MLPFEHVKKSANPPTTAAANNTNSPVRGAAASTSNVIGVGGGTRSGALRPHSRAAATNTQQSFGKTSPVPSIFSPNNTNNNNNNNLAKNSRMMNNNITTTGSLFNTTANSTNGGLITSPLKPTSARGGARSRFGNNNNNNNNNNVTPSRSLNMTVSSSLSATTGNKHTDVTQIILAQRQYKQKSAGDHHHHGDNTNRADDDDDGGASVSACDIIPDFQLCVNYKKVDITVNDAKQHLSVRPPKIKAAVEEITCDLEPYEFAHVFSVSCGLDDVGVDHSVLFFVVSANPECFAVAPTVDCEGTLRFQAAPAAPGSVHLERTTLLVTAWDALSLTGSSITTHADEVSELEDGVPFCTPIKLEVTFAHASIQNRGLHSQHAAFSPNATANVNTTTSTNRSPNIHAAPARALSPSTLGMTNQDENDPEAEVYETASFTRLNPNLLRDPFVVLGSTLQSRVVQCVTSPVTDTELLSLSFIRELFVMKNNKNDNNNNNQTEQELQKIIREKQQEYNKNNNDHRHEDLCQAHENLGRFILENGSSFGDATAVEIFERLVNLRREKFLSSITNHNNHHHSNNNNAIVDPSAKALLDSYNLLTAAEVAIGSYSDAVATLDRAFNLCLEEDAKEKKSSAASSIKDQDAAWVGLRKAYVLLARGEAEEALKLLRHPLLAEVDTVFPDDLALRTLGHILGSCGRCLLGRYGETIKKIRQVLKQYKASGLGLKSPSSQKQEGTTSAAAAADDETNNNNVNDETTAPNSTISASLFVIPLLQTLTLTCLRTGDITQARNLISTIVQDEQAEGDSVCDPLIRGVTAVLANMANVYTPLPADLVAAARGKEVADGNSTSNNNNNKTTILRTPSIIIRAADAWQALMLDPHSTKPREFLRTVLAIPLDNNNNDNHSNATFSPSSHQSQQLHQQQDILTAKLRMLDAAACVATTSAAVSGNVDRQRRAVEHILRSQLLRELQPYHVDVIACGELLAWIELCMGNAQTAAAVAEQSLRDLRAHGADVFDQAPRLAQLLGQANGILNNFTSPAAFASTNETLEDCTLRYGEGTRALFAPLVDRAIAEINSNQFASALEKLHRALKIVDSGNAIFLLGPLFRPAAQLTPEEVTERARLSKGRVDGRAASDFALVLFAMASVAEAEERLFDAETLLLQVLAALELAGIDESICTAAVYRSMSQLLFEDGHYGDALAYVERAEKLLHTKFPYATTLKKQVSQTQQCIEFKIKASGYSLKRISDTRFRFAVFV